jgi:hypothetical protein
MYTVSEDNLKLTMVETLKAEGHTTLANVLAISKLVYDPQWEFSGIISYQRKLYVSIRVPLNFRKMVTDEKGMLSELCTEIYIDDEQWYCLGINNIGILPINTEEVTFENKTVILEKDSVYTNFIKFLVENPRIEDLQKKYLYEACSAGSAGNMLSASVMLGCSAELLLKDLCNAYYQYLLNHGTSTEQSAFENKVIKAKVAYIRLDEFLKRVETNPSLFERFGFENVRLNFNFLDIIRQIRNDSGHPTGNNITDEQFKMMLNTYQAFIDKTINAIQSLPQI